MAPDVDGAQVEEVNALVNKQHDLFIGAGELAGSLRDTDQVAVVTPQQRNRLSLRPVIAGKRDRGYRGLASVSRISRATTTPERNVKAPTTPMAQGMPSRSAITPESSAPRA